MVAEERLTEILLHTGMTPSVAGDGTVLWHLVADDGMLTECGLDHDEFTKPDELGTELYVCQLCYLAEPEDMESSGFQLLKILSKVS